MSAFHCSCGFAIDDPDLLGDHLRAVFERPDETGADGLVHDELVLPDDPDRPPGVPCTCGHVCADAPDFDDHVLLKFTPPDGYGNDGCRHVLIDVSTPPPPMIISDLSGE